MKRSTYYTIIVFSVVAVIALAVAAFLFIKKQMDAKANADNYVSVLIENHSDIDIHGVVLEYYIDRTPSGGVEAIPPENKDVFDKKKPIVLTLKKTDISQEQEGPGVFGMAVTLKLKNTKSLIDVLTEWNVTEGSEHTFVLTKLDDGGFVLTPKENNELYAQVPLSEFSIDLLPKGELHKD